MVARPERVEAERLHAPREPEDRRARGRRAVDRQVAAEFHRGRASVAGEVDETILELTALDHRGEAGALDLAAGRLWGRAGPHQQHPGGAMAPMTLHATGHP